MSKKKDFVFEALRMLSWFIFITLSFNTVTVLFMFIMNFINGTAIQDNYHGLGLNHYIGSNVFLLIIMTLKSILFYHVVQIFGKLNLMEPFSQGISSLLSKISYDALSIAIICVVAAFYEKRLEAIGYNSDMVHRYRDSVGSHLMMAAVLYVISHIFKKGIELQKENELTI